MATVERIIFRLIKMPCCGQLLCWVNPKFPNYCPECGNNIMLTVKQRVTFTDDKAELHTHYGDLSAW
jgi:hypothetical protein